MKKEWNGDVDFGDGSCQEMHQNYLNSLDEVSKLKANVFDSSEKQAVIQLLNRCLIQLKEYLNFIHEGNCIIAQCPLTLVPRPSHWGRGGGGGEKDWYPLNVHVLHFPL